MNIRDIIRETEGAELAALVQLILGRADDARAAGEMPVEVFLNKAKSMGLNVDKDTLQSAVQSGAIGGVADMNDEKIIFKTKKQAELNPPEQNMSLDKAKMTMQQAAHRAANKRK
jgi:hypothetical protein